MSEKKVAKGADCQADGDVKETNCAEKNAHPLVGLPKELPQPEALFLFSVKKKGCTKISFFSAQKCLGRVHLSQ